MRGVRGSRTGAAWVLLATLAACLVLAAPAGAHPGHVSSEATRFQTEEPHPSEPNGLVVAATLITLVTTAGGLAVLKRRTAR